MKKSILLSISTISLFANLEFDSDIRFRYEYMDNFNDKFYGVNPKVGEDSDGYLLSRVRVGAKYKFSEIFLAKLSMQDSRVFGWGFKDSDWFNREFNQKNNPQKDYLELYESYVESNIENFNIKVGRQKIAYGNYQIFGPGEWKNSGKWLWDALRVSYKMDKNFIDLFYGATMLHDEDEFSLNGRHGYYGSGIYGHFEFENFKVEPMVIYKENDKANELYNSLKSYYAGFRIYDDSKKVFYDGTYLKSWGNFEKLNSEEVDIDGFGLSLRGGYKLNKNISFGLAYSYATGDDPNTKDRETFDGVFGASDKYYGRMNLMKFSNLIDYELFAIFKPIKEVNLKFEYHKFYADEPTNRWKSYQISSMREDYYGDEIDLVAKYRVNKNLTLQVGVGYFFAGDYIQSASEVNEYITNDDAFSIFTQIQYKFNIRG